MDSSSSSSARAAALIDATYPQSCESMGFPFTTSPSKPESFSSSALSIPAPLRPKVEHLADSTPVSIQAPTVPRPLESLQGTPIPPFLSKTYELVDDASLDHIISWGPAGESFVVWDQVEFSRAVLPRHFKHNNFSSFVRQLNTYGFRKIGTDRWEFANEDFLRGNKTRLKHINRRRSSHVQIGTQVSSSIGMGIPGAESELQKLRREKELMLQEVAQLRQENLLTVKRMDALNQRMESAEARQKHIVSFLAKVLQNPVFLGHLKLLKEQRKIASTRIQRKFLKQQQQEVSCDVSDRPVDQQIVKYRSRFWDASASGSDSLMPDCGSGETSATPALMFEKSDSKELPEHILQDVLDKLGLDAGGQDPLQACNESQDLEGKTRRRSQMDVCFSAHDYFISLPDDVTPEDMAIEDITPAGLVVSKADSATFPFKGKEIINLETEDTTADTDMGIAYIKTFNEDITQERMFPEAVTPADDCVSNDGIWDLSLETGGSLSSCHALWDCLSHYDAQEMEAVAEAGSCSLWDLGLHNLEEDFDIDKYVGGEPSFQENKDEGGHQNEECRRDLEP